MVAGPVLTTCSTETSATISGQDQQLPPTSLIPHRQWLVFRGAIDQRKDDIRSGELPISVHQFNLMQKLGVTKRYDHATSLDRSIDIQNNFQYKSYVRGIDHVLFRVQVQKSIILRKEPHYLFRILFSPEIPDPHQLKSGFIDVNNICESLDFFCSDPLSILPSEPFFDYSQLVQSDSIEEKITELRF